MTIKYITVDSEIGYGSVMDTHGGQQLQIVASSEMRELLFWWKQWKDVFNSKDPSVVDTLKQARVLHEVTK